MYLSIVSIPSIHPVSQGHIGTQYLLRPEPAEILWSKCEHKQQSESSVRETRLQQSDQQQEQLAIETTPSSSI